MQTPESPPPPPTRLVEASAVHADPPAGSRFGRYHLFQKLGEGGMGVVWKAWDPSLHRYVALKEIRGHDRHPEIAGRFFREARLAARLRHPHIAAIHDVGEEQGRPYFTAEFIDGASLADRLRHGVTVRQAVEWVHAIGGALAYAHAEGIVHRDVKPANIMIAADDRPFLTDFGLAKDVELTVSFSGGATRRPDGGDRTREGALIGTPAYMSPEQVRGAGPWIGPATDQYALAVVLYEGLTGRPPFRAEGLADLLQAIREEEPAPPSRENPRVPPDLETICLKALEKDPQRRYPSLEEFCADLDRYRSGRSIQARRRSRLARLTGRVLRFRRWVAALLAVVGILGGGTLFLAARWEEERERRAGAEALLEKSVRVGATLTQWALVADQLRALEAAFPDPAAAGEDRRRAAAEAWGALEGRAQGGAQDAASRSATLALWGWARRLAGDEVAGLAAMARARALDPDVPLGASLEALVRFEQIVRDLDLPETVWSSAGLETLEPAPESPRVAGLQRDLAVLLDQAGLASAWGAAEMEELRHALEGVRRFNAGRHADAALALDRALAAGRLPTLETALRIARGIARLLSDDDAGAWADLSEAARARPADPLVLRWRCLAGAEMAFARTKAGEDSRADWERVVAAATEALRIDPNRAAMPVILGNACVALGDARAARGIDPGDDYRAAIAAYDRLLNHAFEDVAALGNRGRTHLRLAEAAAARRRDPRPDLAAAKRDLETAASLGPDRSSLWVGLAGVRVMGIQLGVTDPAVESAEIDRALTELDRALDLAPGSVDARLNRAGVLGMRVRFRHSRGEDPGDDAARALADLEEVLRRSPQNDEAIVNRAAVLVEWAHADAARGIDPRAKIARAVADLEAALERRADRPGAWFNLGLCRKRLGDAEEAAGADGSTAYEQAAEAYRRALTLAPGEGRVRYNRGRALEELGKSRARRGGDPRADWRAAAEEFAGAREAGVDPVRARTDRMEVLLELGRDQVARGEAADATLREVIGEASALIELAPGAANAWNHRGAAWRELGESARRRGENPAGDFAQAASDITAALARNPRSWTALANRARLHEALGDAARALLDYEAAAALVPEHPIIRGEIARLRAALGK